MPTAPKKQDSLSPPFMIVMNPGEVKRGGRWEAGGKGYPIHVKYWWFRMSHEKS